MGIVVHLILKTQNVAVSSLSLWFRMKGKIMNSQTSTKQTKAQPNKTTVKSVENVCAMKRLLKIKTYKMTFHHATRHFVTGTLVARKSLVLSLNRARNIRGGTVVYHF